MKTGPLGVGRYALNISRSFIARMRAPSSSTGNAIFALGRTRRNVTMRFALGLTLNRLYGSVVRSWRRCSIGRTIVRSEEHTSELQSRLHLVCRLLLEKKKKKNSRQHPN